MPFVRPWDAVIIYKSSSRHGRHISSFGFFMPLLARLAVVKRSIVKTWNSMVGRGEIRYAYRANFNLPLLYIQSNYFMAKCIFVSCLVRDKLLYEPIVRWTILRPLSAASNDLSRVVCVAKFDIAEFAI